MYFSNHFKGTNERSRLHLRHFIILGYLILFTQLTLWEPSSIGIVVHQCDFLVKREVMVRRHFSMISPAMSNNMTIYSLSFHWMHNYKCIDGSFSLLCRTSLISLPFTEEQWKLRRKRTVYWFNIDYMCPLKRGSTIQNGLKRVPTAQRWEVPLL